MDAQQGIETLMGRGSKKDDGDARIGLLVGNYRVVRLIGEGGMGAVYEAVHEDTKNRIAVKFLRELPEDESEGEATSRQRFLNEANLLAKARRSTPVRPCRHVTSQRSEPVGQSATSGSCDAV